MISIVTGEDTKVHEKFGPGVSIPFIKTFYLSIKNLFAGWAGDHILLLQRSPMWFPAPFQEVHNYL